MLKKWTSKNRFEFWPSVLVIENVGIPAIIYIFKAYCSINQGDQIGKFFANWATFGGSLWFFEKMKLKARFWSFCESQWNFSLEQLRVAKLEHKLYLITWSLAYNFSLKVLRSLNWVNFVCLGYNFCCT
jgi:hypothetical protein